MGPLQVRFHGSSLSDQLFHTIWWHQRNVRSNMPSPPSVFNVRSLSLFRILNVSTTNTDQQLRSIHSPVLLLLLGLSRLAGEVKYRGSR